MDRIEETQLDNISKAAMLMLIPLKPTGGFIPLGAVTQHCLWKRCIPE